MKFAFICHFWCFLSVFAILHTHAAPTGINPDESLNKEQIKSLYFEGDFNKVKEALEHFRQNNKNASKKEKVFTYKFLSVVYAADPKTKAKGESYMYRLLKLVPTVELLDLYVSDTIEKIFQDVKSRYMREQKYESNYDLYGEPKEENLEGSEGDAMAALMSSPKENETTDNSNSEDSKIEKKSNSWVKWTVGGVAVGGVIAGYLLLSNNSDPEDETVLKFNAGDVK